MCDAVQRQVIKVFGGRDPSKQSGYRHAAADDGGRHRLRNHGFACPAGILRTDVAVHKEFGGFDVELFGDVFADFYQITATLLALTGLQFMPVFDAWQMIWKWLAPGACKLGLLRNRQLLDFRFNRRNESPRYFRR